MTETYSLDPSIFDKIPITELLNDQTNNESDTSSETNEFDDDILHEELKNNYSFLKRNKCPPTHKQPRRAVKKSLKPEPYISE